MIIRGAFKTFLKCNCKYSLIIPSLSSSPLWEFRHPCQCFYHEQNNFWKSCWWVFQHYLWLILFSSIHHVESLPLQLDFQLGIEKEVVQSQIEQRLYVKQQASCFLTKLLLSESDIMPYCSAKIQSYLYNFTGYSFSYLPLATIRQQISHMIRSYKLLVDNPISIEYTSW